MRRLAPLTSLVFILPACTAPERSVPDIACAPPATRPALSGDSTVALCLAPGYQPAGANGHFWARGSPTDTAYAWLSVVVLDSLAAAAEWGTPPTPSSFRRPGDSTVIHAISAESVAVHRETIDGHSVEVETALVSGGFAGDRQRPAVRAVWTLPGARWVLVQGRAQSANALDTLRAMLRTVRVGGAATSRLLPNDR